MPGADMRHASHSCHHTTRTMSNQTEPSPFVDFCCLFRSFVLEPIFLISLLIVSFNFLHSGLKINQESSLQGSFVLVGSLMYLKSKT